MNTESNDKMVKAQSEKKIVMEVYIAHNNQVYYQPPYLQGILLWCKAETGLKPQVTLKWDFTGFVKFVNSTVHSSLCYVKAV